MEKLSKKQLNFFIRDERMAAREYHDLGLHKLEADERRHMNFFKMLKGKR